MFGLQMLKRSLFKQFRRPKFPPSLIEVVARKEHFNTCRPNMVKTQDIFSLQKIQK